MVSRKFPVSEDAVQIYEALVDGDDSQVCPLAKRAAVNIVIERGRRLLDPSADSEAVMLLPNARFLATAIEAALAQNQEKARAVLTKWLREVKAQQDRASS